MILLNKPEDINRFFAELDGIEEGLDGAPKYLVLRMHEVDTMVNTLNYHNTGLKLQLLGYNYIVPIFNDLPDAIEASRNFKYSIGVIGIKERGVITNDTSISDRF